MAKRQAKRIRRELAPEERERWENARRDAGRDKEAILARGRQVKAARSRVQVALRDAFTLLKAEREAQPNPTIVTLTRYAEALGKRLVVSLE